MVPEPQTLPDVLPTGRLQASGMPVPAVRSELRRISNARSAVTVAACLLQTFGVVAAAMWIGQWWAYLFAFVWMGRGHCLLNILGHEAAHRLLFTWRWLNDGVGKWLLAYPTFQAFAAYRRVHFAHHKDEMGPDEPDLALYAGYPIPPDSMRRKLTRDMFFVSGSKNMVGLGRAVRARSREAWCIVAVQVVLFGACIVAGQWWVYPVIWVAPWMTLWKFSNRLRAIAEHAGMIRSKDRRAHHARRAADPVGSPPLRAVQHGLAPGAPRRHGRAVAPPPRPARRARSGRMGHGGAHVPELSSPLAAARLGRAPSGAPVNRRVAAPPPRRQSSPRSRRTTRRPSRSGQ